ncbi:NMCC_0638 family (lipo)protein [Acidisphaera sp. S103]|uniref:NMCC_0638 family (lipo)protein n=1 Tax=Acidisphaera sp. S103 TaxID=1747223 RepID=UPI0038D0DDAB
MPGAARAGAPDELVGLFIQGCMEFTGDAPALRDWAKQTGLPPVSEKARIAFLRGVPGQAFDGSAAEGRLALISADDGTCSAAAEQATQQAVDDAVEAGFRQAGLTFTLVLERDDTVLSPIHDRVYRVTKGKRGWQVLVATVNGDKGGEAMLTASAQ